VIAVNQAAAQVNVIVASVVQLITQVPVKPLPQIFCILALARVTLLQLQSLLVTLS
jgi:hypothetical protein